MKNLIHALLIAGLTTLSVAQVNSQSTSNGSSNTSVSASKSGASANTKNSATVNQNSNSNMGNASGNASASQNANANANTNQAGLPAGTKIPAVLDKSIDSRKCKPGDQVMAKTSSDVVSEGTVVIPRNSKLIGHVTQAKSKAKGETESTLGIVFDKAVLKNGRTLPMQANIQALAAPALSATGSAFDDSANAAGGGMASGSASGGGSPAGGPLGGTVNGVTSTAGGAVGNVAGTTGNVAGSAGSAIGTTANGVGQTGAATLGATGALSSTSSGVIGLKNLRLDSSNSSSAAGSVISSTGKNVRLAGGSQMVLNVTGSTSQQ